jgi:sugar lactone lactonase YvrE
MYKFATRHRWNLRQASIFFALMALSVSTAKAEPAQVVLPGDSVYPESVTSTADGTFYVGSLAGGGIFRVAPGASQADVWIKPGTFGTRSILGVYADEKSQTLWVCSNDLSSLGVAGPSKVPGGWLKGFDLKTGVGKVSARFAGKKNFCNDIVVGKDGSVYVTNSWQPQILKLNPATQKLEVWDSDTLFMPPAKGVGLDGIAFSADGDLYVNTFNEAKLFHIEVKNGKPGAVSQVSASQPLGLPDALRLLGGDAFLMIEGVGKLDRVTFDGNEATIETLKDGLNGPTSLTLRGATAWVSEGQLQHLSDKPEPKPILPFRLVPVAIPKP